MTQRHMSLGINIPPGFRFKDKPFEGQGHRDTKSILTTGAPGTFDQRLNSL